MLTNKKTAIKASSKQTKNTAPGMAKVNHAAEQWFKLLFIHINRDKQIANGNLPGAINGDNEENININ